MECNTMFNKMKFYQLSILVFSLIISFKFPATYFNTNLDYSISGDKYVVDDRGNILMHVNIIGHVKNPGRHLVHEGINILSAISVAGGYLPGTNLKNITLVRESENGDAHNMKIINLDEFYKSGNKNPDIILPNDTIIVEEKVFSSIFRRNNTLNSILQILNIYLQITKNQ